MPHRARDNPWGNKDIKVKSKCNFGAQKGHKMNRVISILMKRDNMTLEEAKDLIADTREEIEDAVACGDYEYADDILADNLGLEPDYMLDVLGL